MALGPLKKRQNNVYRWAQHDMYHRAPLGSSHYFAATIRFDYRTSTAYLSTGYHQQFHIVGEWAQRQTQLPPQYKGNFAELFDFP
tara:strand:- start:20 stop:274 length:255 start_codon:yes stop_codon:yes gene_type:complete